MPAAIRLTIEGAEELKNEFAGVARRYSGGRVHLAAIMPFFDRVAEKFDQEGPGWTELSEWRLEDRRDKPDPILDFSGQLRYAATSWQDQNGLTDVDMTVRSAGGATSWTLSGEKVENQFGNKMTNLRARKFWPMDRDWAPTVEKMGAAVEGFFDAWIARDLDGWDAALSRSQSTPRGEVHW